MKNNPPDYLRELSSKNKIMTKGPDFFQHARSPARASPSFTSLITKAIYLYTLTSTCGDRLLPWPFSCSRGIVLLLRYQDEGSIFLATLTSDVRLLLLLRIPTKAIYLTTLTLT